MKPCHLCKIGTATEQAGNIELCKLCASKFQDRVLALCYTCGSYNWLPKSEKVIGHLVRVYGMTPEMALYGANVIGYATCPNCNQKCPRGQMHH